MRTTLTLLGSLAGLMALSAAAAPGGGPAAAPTREAAAAPAPQVLSPAEEGRRTYLRLNCYGCHGMFAAGAMGPNIIGAERGDVSEAVLQGKDEGMPSYRAYVSSTDITNLTRYLGSIGTPAEPVFMDWWKKVPPK